MSPYIWVLFVAVPSFWLGGVFSLWLKGTICEQEQYRRGITMGIRMQKAILKETTRLLESAKNLTD